MEQREVQFLIIVVSIALFFMLILILGIVNYIQRKKVQFILERERANANYEEELLNSRMEISEHNLKNISWELHDNIGQLMSVASMKSKMMMTQAEVSKDDLEDVSKLITESLQEIRSLSRTLNRERVETIGLRESLKTELDRIERLRIVDTELYFPKSIQFDKDKEIIIFRILQEIIANVVRHAQATQLSVTFDQVGDKTLIEASDNGVGFNYDALNSNSGLINMESRAKLIGADFIIESKPGKGTTLSLTL